MMIKLVIVIVSDTELPGHAKNDLKWMLDVSFTLEQQICLLPFRLPTSNQTAIFACLLNREKRCL